MSAITLATNIFGIPEPTLEVTSILKFLVEKYEGLPAVEEILKDPEFKQTLRSNLPKELKVKKKSSLSDEDRQGQYDPDKCDARIWIAKPRSGGLGYDSIQCSAKKQGDGCLCKKHKKMYNEEKLWTGLITEPRPEEPKKLDGTRMFWCTDKDGKEIIKDKKVRKSSEKKVKAKKSPEDMNYEEVEQLLKEMKEKKKKKDQEQEKEKKDQGQEKKKKDQEEEQEQEKGQEQGQEQGQGKKKKEQDDELELDLNEVSKVNDEDTDDEDYYTLKEINGVEYQINKEDGSVIRVDDFTPVGVWDKDEEEIIFDDE